MASLKFLKTSLFLTTLLTSCQVCFAFRLFTNATVPRGLSSKCTSTLLRDFPPCSNVVSSFRSGYYYPVSTLQRACTLACQNDLAYFENEVLETCSSETWAGTDGEGSEPVSMISGLLQYNFDQTCLQDGERWCNQVIGYAAVLQEPGSAQVGYVDSTIGGKASDVCDMCFIKNLRMQAGSPFYGGPAIASQSLYESKTASCGITNMPLTVSSPNATFTTPSTTSNPSPCAGKSYIIKPTDDCFCISEEQGIGTAWLLSDNALSAYCANFPQTGQLCLTNTCSVHVIGTNDSCLSIARSSGISIAQLKAWNPIINAGCYNLDKMVSHSLCISQPGGSYKPANVSAFAAPATTPAPIPSDIANGTTTRCAQYYHVVTGDYCNKLVLAYAISLADFRSLNPGVDVNCNFLLAGYSYCVRPVGDINTYPGRPGVEPMGTPAVDAAGVASAVSWADAQHGK